MSLTNRPLASTSTVLRCGCGALATAVLASRLGEKAADTARASGVPAWAMNSLFTANRRTWLCTLWNLTIWGRP